MKLLALLLAFTLPSSGPISLNDITNEFQIPANSTFPGAFYGLGGAPTSGALSLQNFYGRSRFSLTANKTGINATGYRGSDVATITSTTSTGFSFSLVSGDPAGRVVTGATSGTSTTLGINTPATGCGSTSGVYRITASNGDHIDINFSAFWGTC